MKKHWVGLLGMGLFLVIMNPVLASASEQKTALKPTTLTTVDRKVTDLSKRLSSLESDMGRFRLGGSFAIEPTISPDYNFGMMDIKQRIDLSLDVAIDENILFSLRMAQPGSWGASAYTIPLMAPLQVNEVFLRIARKYQQNYLGRFRYSLGQYGLVADLYVNPVEGLVVQQQFGDFYGIGLYSRIGPKIDPKTNTVIGIEDYSAVRLGWMSPTTVVGLNLVPNGFAGEKAWSIDWSWNRGASEVRAELGWYSYHLAGNTDYQVDWTPGILIGYSKTFQSEAVLQLKTGYFPETFKPTSTSLGQVSGITREWFVNNSQGVEVYFRKRISDHWETENRLIAFAPVPVEELTIDYRLRSSLIRTFSTVNQMQFGVEGNTFEGKLYSRAFLSWNLRF